MIPDSGLLFWATLYVPDSHNVSAT